MGLAVDLCHLFAIHLLKKSPELDPGASRVETFGLTELLHKVVRCHLYNVGRGLKNTARIVAPGLEFRHFSNECVCALLETQRLPQQLRNLAMR